MSTNILVGAQWGDEGKGKITDFLAEKADVVARCQGGSNAGHTVISGDNEYKLHLIPSGILYNDTICVIGNGVVIDLESLLGEIKGLEDRGISMDSLRISDRAQLIMPYHKLIDKLEEESKSSDNKIGTTGKGIGPCYVDKAQRCGLRVCDLFDPDEFKEKLANVLKLKNDIIVKIYGGDPFDLEPIFDQFMKLAEIYKPYITDTSVLVDEAIKAGKSVLFEGAQGTLLDIDHGTYPFVTSSAPIAGGACTGIGVGPTKIDAVVGVAKAYTTRVGSGPFPTELEDSLGEHLRTKGGEFGTTTGRARRCGWLDMVVLRYGVRINGITDIALTKVDVLDDMEEVKICTAYKYGDKILTEFPASVKILSQCVPQYESMPGWKCNTSDINEFDKLPIETQNYINRIEELSEAKVSIVSIGPKRTQTILRKEF